MYISFNKYQFKKNSYLENTTTLFFIYLSLLLDYIFNRNEYIKPLLD